MPDLQAIDDKCKVQCLFGMDWKIRTFKCSTYKIETCLPYSVFDHM